MAIQVLLIEDNMALATTISAYLELEGVSCDFAANGVEGLNLALNNRYQTILLDINLPRMNGLEVCQALREQGVEVPVLMLTARETIEDKLAGFQAGTDDYLVKPFEMRELVARIHALAYRRSAQTKRLMLGDLEIDIAQKTAVRAGKKLDLTPTGWTILLTLMRCAPNVVTRHALEEAIWDQDVPDSNLLKVHMYRLRQQVDKPFKVAMIKTIQGHGFVIQADEK